MQRPATQTPTTTQSESVANRSNFDLLPRRSPQNMAAATQQSIHHTLPHIGYREQHRPTLPPLSNLENTIERHSTSPLTTPPITRVFNGLDPFSRQSLPQPSPSSRTVGIESRYPHSGFGGGQPPGESRDPFLPIQYQGSPHDGPENPLKRSHGAMTQQSPRYPVPPQLMTPNFTDQRIPYNQPAPMQFPPSSRSSYSDASTPSQTHSISSFMGQGTAQEVKAMLANPHESRLSLHIRQQPRAARAGPDGKDRRAIDPPPVLQLMIDNFDIDDDDDMNELRSSYFVVHCRLVSATTPRKDLSTTQTINEDGTHEIQRLLLGTTVASPFYCADDPDPENMPTHPVRATVERPPASPTSRFIPSRSKVKGKEKTPKPKSLPGSFFIFADLSVRKAGEYRLEFCLMKIEASSMMTGKNLPIVHTVHSDVFKVVNAKDFDQVQPSTELVRGLLDRGAGFPLKLKKGIREGQRRRQTGGESDDDDDEDEDHRM